MTSSKAGLLEARDITFSYSESEPVLDGISCDFWAGEVVSLTGRSGRGKSTLLYMLGLLHQPHSGEIWIEGVRVSALSDARRAALRAQQFGFIFQDAALDPTRTILDNVIEASVYRMTSRTRAVARALAIMSELEVVHRIDHRPGQVSGGQAQRIALCRALLFDPRIIIADEPTGNLDADTSNLVMKRLRSAAHNGATVIIATHDESVVSQSDRQIRL